MNKFHKNLLTTFRAELYDKLFWHSHLTSSNPKMVYFEDEGIAPVKGYYLKKNNKLYLLPYELLDKLPLSALTTHELVTKTGKDVCNVITSVSSLRILPEQRVKFHELVDAEQFKHTNPDAWTLWKIICWSARLSRVCCRVSGLKSFGKTGYFELINWLYDRSYVVIPRTLPGLCIGITPDGVIVLDELSNVETGYVKSISNVLFQLGSMFDTLKSGSAGSASHGTLPLYKIPHLSCICIYNMVEDYKDANKFFDNMFPNNTAINDRFLPLRLPESDLDQAQFIDHPVMDNELRNHYIDLAKTASYYQSLAESNTLLPIDERDIVHRHVDRYAQFITGRHMTSFRNIAYFIYLYSEKDPTLFYSYLDMLHSWYKSYMDAVNGIGFQPGIAFTEEAIN